MPSRSFCSYYLNQIKWEDVGQINDLLKQLSPKSMPVGWTKIQRIMKKGWIVSARKESPEALAAYPNGKLIGIAILVAPPEKLTGYFSIIEDVVVDERYRRRGIGTKLVEILISKGRKLKLKYIDLTSGPNRVETHQLYKSLGFVQRETHVFRLQL